MASVTFSSSSRSPDWVVSPTSNAHLTNDRSWFTDEFTEIDSHISNAHVSIANIPVRGLGTVILPVQQLATGQGHTINGSMRLQRVLYVPDYPCNVVGGPIRSLATIHFSSLTPRGSLVYGDGSVAAIFMPGRNFYQIMLRSPPVGPPLGRSVFEQHPEYGHMAAFTWAEDAQQRCLSFLSAGFPNLAASSCATNREVMPITSSVGVDASYHRSRKRRAQDEDYETSPSTPTSPMRAAKRPRAMGESNCRARRILPAVLPARG
ncbi:hypothetical protein GMORB2_6476 [Geosmithia morbida]|uniref:Uncharacterized protein n=1 Tax=Geosmithia morbida TaxID=1094350 RepID=A0A9P5D0N4_9HYPO|nr:uncharacterized protein GMORB2_6476 [Geosmithia morbida]KAF4122928.1 hypothetical protein GMORB2_6476 [Geosmithia morbida]